MAVSGWNTPAGRASTPVDVSTFSAAPSIHSFSGLLFDMDGTIIDSTAAVVKHWHTIGEKFGVDPEVILTTSHGRRSIDVMQSFAPEYATWKYICEMEGQLPKLYGRDAKELPGARRLLANLEAASAPWAIVTSGTLPLVSGWLEVLKLTSPKNLITAEDVPNGKPDPACYALGRSRLGFTDSAEMLVFEDAPAGIRAGKAAGCKVVGLTTTHSISQVRDAGADWIVRDLGSVIFKGMSKETGKVLIEIRDAFRD